MRKDHALVEQLMGELRLEEGQPTSLPRPAIDRFIKDALAIERGDELYRVVRGLGAWAAAFAATKRESLAKVLVVTLEALLARLDELAARDVAAEAKRLSGAPKATKPSGAAGALAPPKPSRRS